MSEATEHVDTPPMGQPRRLSGPPSWNAAAKRSVPA